MNSAVSRRTMLAGIASLAALPLTACASAKPPVKIADDLVRAQGMARSRPTASAPVATAAAGMVAFGHDLCRAGTKSGSNWVASPLSIACAFAMACVGAKGATAAALDRFFGFPATGRDDAFNAITQSLVTTVGPPPAPSAKSKPAPPVVALGNALFAQRDFAVQAAFLRTLAAKYGAGVRSVDFTTAGALNQINAWVSQETAGRITKLFSELDSSTRFVLANTVYLRASWLDTFAEYPTTAAPFTTGDGRSVSVPMMHDVGTRGYATGTGGWQALSMLYASGDIKNPVSDLAMWLILPPLGGDPVDMLTPATLSEVGGSLRSTPVDVTVPKWDFATTIDLGEVLSGLGLHDVFGTGDFGGIATGIGGISSAIHRANITVDEYGTEAAAVTGLAFATGAMAPPKTAFHADRPFAFTIVGGPAHVPLFTGIVNDPTACPDR